MGLPYATIAQTEKLVKEEIGKMPSPAEGGTKLYLHDITLTKADAAPIGFSIVTTSQESATIGSSAGMKLLSLKKDTFVNIYGPYIYSLLLFTITSTEHIFMLFIYDLSNNRFNQQNLTGYEITDIVTEL